MKRIAVIGNAGGGKSTLCRKLSKALDVPLYVIDKLQWKPGWIPADLKELLPKHNEIIARETWVIDGWGTEEMLKSRFERADTIILVDHSLWLHYWWSAKRQIKSVFGAYDDGPEGCPMLPVTWRLVKLIWAIHHQTMPHLREVIRDFGDRKRIIHIRSPRDLKQFYKDLDHTLAEA
jgi:adenylate kinase family enzyme